MGQRLVIRVYDNQNDNWEEGLTPLLAVYYHWSAYSEEALPVLKRLAKLFNTSEEDKLKAFIEALSLTEARLCEEDSHLLTRDPNRFGLLAPTERTPLNRNEGLVAFMPSTCDEYYSMAEATVDVYLDELQFDFSQFLDMGEVLDCEDPESLPEVFQHLPLVSFDEKSIQALQKLIESHSQYFVN